MFWFGALPPYFHQTRDICNSSNDDEYRHQPTNQAGVLSGSLVQYSHIFLASPSSSHNCLTNHCLNINTSQPGLISCQPQKKKTRCNQFKEMHVENFSFWCVLQFTRVASWLIRHFVKYSRNCTHPGVWISNFFTNWSILHVFIWKKVQEVVLWIFNICVLATIRTSLPLMSEITSTSWKMVLLFS